MPFISTFSGLQFGEFEAKNSNLAPAYTSSNSMERILAGFCCPNNIRQIKGILGFDAEHQYPPEPVSTCDNWVYNLINRLISLSLHLFTFIAYSAHNTCFTGSLWSQTHSFRGVSAVNPILKGRNTIVVLTGKWEQALLCHLSLLSTQDDCHPM